MKLKLTLILLCSFIMAPFSYALMTKSSRVVPDCGWGDYEDSSVRDLAANVAYNWDVDVTLERDQFTKVYTLVIELSDTTLRYSIDTRERWDGEIGRFYSESCTQIAK